jgi:hypothetical protein
LDKSFDEVANAKLVALDLFIYRFMHQKQTTNSTKKHRTGNEPTSCGFMEGLSLSILAYYEANYR